MADFQNLTAEIDTSQNNEDLLGEGNDETSLLDQAEEDVNASASTSQNNDGGNDQRAEIPAALLEAEAQHRDEQERERSSIFMQNDDDDDDDENALFPDEDYEVLKRLWIQEVNSTEILHNDDELIPMLMEMLPGQEEIIEQFQDQARNNSSTSGNVDAHLASLAASVCKMDMDRMCFLLADLKRIRLGKIEKYAIHNREVLDRLSDEETNYLSEYGQLFENHMCRSVTDHIPKEAWRKLDEPSMIERPNLNNYVFCEVVHEEGVVIDNHKGMDIDQDEELNGVEPERHYDPGSYLFARYGVVRDLVSEGKVDLLM